VKMLVLSRFSCPIALLPAFETEQKLRFEEYYVIEWRELQASRQQEMLGFEFYFIQCSRGMEHERPRIEDINQESVFPEPVCACSDCALKGFEQ